MQSIQWWMVPKRETITFSIVCFLIGRSLYPLTYVLIDSGHSEQITNRNGTEEDGKDEGTSYSLN